MIADRLYALGSGNMPRCARMSCHQTAINHLPFPDAQASDAVVDGARTASRRRLAQRYRGRVRNRRSPSLCHGPTRRAMTVIILLTVPRTRDARKI